MESASKGFTQAFAADWRRCSAKAVVFAVIFPLIPLSVLAALLAIGGYSGFKTLVLVLAAIVTAVLFMPGIIVACSAPRVLAPIALGIVERLGLDILVFYPVLGDTLVEKPYFKWTFRAGVNDEELNSILAKRIWWVSSEPFPKSLPGVAVLDDPDSKSLPVSLLKLDLPLTGPSGYVLYGWKLLLVTAVPSLGCGCIGINSFDPMSQGVLVFHDVHRLAYSAAYYKGLTEKWPWEAL